MIVLAALAAVPAALAHGDAMIRAAGEALAREDVYVHPDAIPTLTRDEVAELESRIEDAGGEIYVAVLPADALHEAKDAETVLVRVVERAAHGGSYAVVVGGQFQATSTPGDLGPATGARLARDAFRERKALAPTLYAWVELVRQERERTHVPADEGGRSDWLVAAAALLALVGIVLLAPLLRSGSAATLRRARRRSSVG